MPKYTEKKRASNQKWDAANLDRISIALPKGKKDEIKAHAENQGESMNQFIGRAINQQMERDKEGKANETNRKKTNDCKIFKRGVME